MMSTCAEVWKMQLSLAYLNRTSSKILRLSNLEKQKKNCKRIKLSNGLQMLYWHIIGVSNFDVYISGTV